VYDILAAVRAVRDLPEAKQRRVLVAARDRMTVAALLAASLDTGIDRLLLTGGMRSWAGLVEAEEYKEPFANFLPGVLAVTDLPALAAALGQRLISGKSWTDESFLAI
jgi:hypothetical protein